MSLTAKDIDEITRLLEDSSFDELRPRDRRGEDSPARAAGRSASAARRLRDAPGAAPRTSRHRRAGAAPAAAKPPDDRALVEVRAPLLGMFYRAPKPGAPPFVEVGAQVEPDTIIGIIEVMKLMNTVRAGVRGEVGEILRGRRRAGRVRRDAAARRSAASR